MSIQRIKGDDGVIIDSTTFLELPKSPTAAGKGAVRPGMIRYNTELKAFEGVIASDVGNNYRRFVNLDQNGKILISNLPDGLASGMVYKGTFNPVLDDIDPPSVAGVYTSLPEASADTAGQYWIVRGLMNYAHIHYSANTPSTSPVIFTPDNPNGGSQWIEIKYYFNKSGEILGAFGRISIESFDEVEHAGLSTLVNDANLTKFGTKIGNELAFADGDWILSSATSYSRIRETRASILASAVAVSSSLVDKSGRVLAGSSAGTVQNYLDGLVLNAMRRGGDSMVADGSAANGRLAFVYGTAAAPAMTFNSTAFDPDNASGMNPALWSDSSTGLFHPGVGMVGISSSGTERFRVSPTAAILYQANGINTASSAALQLSHSTNTAVAGLTAVNNVLYLTVAGAAQAELSSTGMKLAGTLTSAGGNLTGNVVIGTSGGNNTLTIHSASTFNSTALFNGNVTIGDAAADTLNIVSTTAFSSPVAMNGNVTIGDAADDTLIVTSTSTFASPVLMNGNVTIGDAAADVITINGTSTFAATAPVTMNGNLTVKGNTIIGDAASDTITINGTSTFAATAPVTMNGNLTVKGNTIIGDASTDTLTVVSTSTFSNPVNFNGNVKVGDAAADTLTVTSTSTFASPVTFTGNVVVGDASTDTLTITSTSTFASPVTMNGDVTIGDTATDVLTVTSASTFASPVAMNGNVTIGDAAADTLTVTSTSTFVNPVLFNGAVTIGDAAADVVTVKGTTNVTAPLTLTNTTLTLAGTTSAVLSKVATGVQLSLAAATEEFVLKGSTTTLASVGNYGVLLPVINSSSATVKVGAVAYDSTKAAVVAGIGTAWVDISTKGGTTAFTATWTTDTPNSEIYAEVAVSGAKDATAYEDKGTYFERRSDVKIRIYTDKVRVVLASTGTAFAGRIYINK